MSLCGDLFTDPKTILCLHTFCKRCIEWSTECPLCRAPLPPDGIVSSPTDFSIKRLVEIYGKRDSPTEESRKVIKCEKCEEVAVIWCLDCDNEQLSFMSRFATILHKKWKDFKCYKTVPIDEMLQNPKHTLGTPEKAEFCQSHIKQPLNLYCKTRGSLIC